MSAPEPSPCHRLGEHVTQNRGLRPAVEPRNHKRIGSRRTLPAALSSARRTSTSARPSTSPWRTTQPAPASRTRSRRRRRADRPEGWGCHAEVLEDLAGVTALRLRHISNQHDAGICAREQFESLGVRSIPMEHDAVGHPWACGGIRSEARHGTDHVEHEVPCDSDRRAASDIASNSGRGSEWADRAIP